MKEDKREEIVKIEWSDSSSLRDSSKEWYKLDELKQRAEEDYKEPCIAIGYILEQNNRYLIVAATKAGNVYSDTTMIPKVNVKSIKKLK